MATKVLLTEEDRQHPVFHAKSLEEVLNLLAQLYDEYTSSRENPAYRILRVLSDLAEVQQGLRLEIKKELQSAYKGWSTASWINGEDKSGFLVKFDGHQLSTGVPLQDIERFWWEGIH